MSCMNNNPQTLSMLSSLGLKPIMIPFVGMFYVPFWMPVLPFFYPD